MRFWTLSTSTRARSRLVGRWYARPPTKGGRCRVYSGDDIPDMSMSHQLDGGPLVPGYAVDPRHGRPVKYRRLR